MFLIEPLLGLLKILYKKKDDLHSLFCYVALVDSLIYIASLREGLDEFCIPTIHEKGIVTQSIYHPLIFSCVSNDINIIDKSILLTGSNMSGKTSFIRCIGINLLSGLTINTCFAKSISIPKARFFSAINISDDLMNDKSYYFEEVLGIKEMINKSREGQNIFLLDEIFKGTNTIERISAVKAVLSFLASQDSQVFVSTHDIELCELLSEEFDIYHFCEIVKDNKIEFDFTLKKGQLKNRNAIRILELNDYPEGVIEEARRLVDILEK